MSRDFSNLYLNLSTMSGIREATISDLEVTQLTRHHGRPTRQAIKSTSTPLDSVDVVDEESDPAVAYEKKQTVLDTIRVARDTLNDNDWSLFSRHYLEKETTDDIAISERVTRQAIEKKLKRCVNKVTKAMNI